MFPKCSLSEARSALSIAKGDMEEAVRLIIEGDVQLSPTPINVSLSVTEKLFASLISNVFKLQCSQKYSWPMNPLILSCYLIATLTDQQKVVLNVEMKEKDTKKPLAH